MKIKTFVLNKNNKIEITEKQLKQLLNEAYWEGYTDGSFSWRNHPISWKDYIIPTTPSWKDHTITTTPSWTTTSSNITIKEE